METFLTRYRNGEYEQVWAELLALEGKVRKEPLYSEALAVARETMIRAKKNIETLIERINLVDYKFSPEYPVIESLEQETFDLIANLEGKVGGPIPLSLKVFYEIVGAVSFYGVHTKLGINLAGYEAVEDEEWFSTFTQEEVDMYYGRDVPVSDPLVVYEPLSSEPESYEYSFGPSKYYIPIAPDALHKANYSGGGGHLIEFPNPAIDAPLVGDWEGTTFVEYLREVFCWGGFPGFRKIEDAPIDLLAFLAKDLLPI